MAFLREVCVREVTPDDRRIMELWLGIVVPLNHAEVRVIFRDPAQVAGFVELCMVLRLRPMSF